MSQTIPPKHLVLYADDDKDDLLLIEEALSQSLNIELVTAGDGEEALSYLNSLTSKDKEPCLIILDVNMPKLNGKEALMRLRRLKRFENIPVVLFTTSSLAKDQEFARRYNAGFVTKPLNSKQMQHITNQFVEYCTDDIKKNIRKEIN